MVSRAIEQARQAAAQRNGLEHDRIIREYARLAFADPRDLMEWGPGGVILRDSAALTDDQAAVVAEVSETRTDRGSNLKLKLHSKLGALDSLSKIAGLLVERHDVTVDGGIAHAHEIRQRIIADPEASRLAHELLGRLAAGDAGRAGAQSERRQMGGRAAPAAPQRKAR